MTRILHVIASADPKGGGPIEGARRVGEIWRRAGHEQDFVTLDAPGATFLEALPGATFALGNLAAGRRWLRYGYSPGMPRWIARHARDYDAVIISGLWNFSVLAARLALTRGRTPYFVFTHGMLDPWFRRQYPLKNLAKQISWLANEGPLLRQARAVLFTTEEERVQSHGAFFPYRVDAQVVGYGTADVPTDRAAQIAAFRVRVPAVTERPFLLFMSRIHAKKGCDLLIDAFADIAGAAPGLDLVIAGPGDAGLCEALQAQAVARGVGARVHFPGMLLDDVKWGALAACEAMTLTSHQENFGVIVAEALAMGKPVLISDKVNIWREVAGDGAGLVEPDTADGSRRLLERFLALTPDARAMMGKAARTSYLARFTAQSAADRLMAVIQAGIVADRRTPISGDEPGLPVLR